MLPTYVVNQLYRHIRHAQCCKLKCYFSLVELYVWYEVYVGPELFLKFYPCAISRFLARCEARALRMQISVQGTEEGEKGPKDF